MKAMTTNLVVAALAACATLGMTTLSLTPADEGQETEKTQKAMDLGAFSVSLTVKDLEASRAFYEKLDFRKIGGEAEQNWLILQNGTTTIGLFQGMFESNMMTFNPGWTYAKETPENFEDVRVIQARLKDRGLELTTEADESTSGPASFTLADPDGNLILFDQHVPSPGD
jgi:catechol 2,3-dioxygenase-like lactoylglutathione lyase family enzyme